MLDVRPTPNRPRTVLFLLLALWLAAGCADEPDRTAATPVEPVVGGEKEMETFTLRAYGADSVTLAGTFNGWNANDPTYAFTLQPDGYTWTLTTFLTAGLQEYKFVLHAGGVDTWLTDPEAHEVSGVGDPAQANAVRGRILPEVSPLPEPIDRTKLVIYEFNVNEISATGTFAGAISALTSGADIEDLGVNAVELMPITAPSYNGWGYDPSLYFAPNNAFGWPTFLAMFVDACHDRGIAVIVDVVLNHAAGGSVLRQLDTFAGSYNFTTTESNPWGMVELNWSNDALREHIRDGLIHWVDTYDVDGFRFDYVEGEGWDTWEYVRDELRAHDPDLLLIGEDYRYPVDGNSVTHGYDAQWGGNHTDGWGGGGNNFLQVMTTILTQNGFSFRGDDVIDLGCFSLACRNMWAAANVISPNGQYDGSNGDGFSDVKYLESHDENRLVWAVDNYGSAGAQTVGGLQKSRVGALALFTSVGIPMLFAGQEVGSDEFRDASPTLYSPDFVGGDQALRSCYRNLIRLRLNEPALRTENVFFKWRADQSDHTENTLCYWRGSSTVETAAEVVVQLNFDHLAHTVDVPFPVDGQWLRFHPENGAWEWIDVTGGSLSVALDASSGVLFRKLNGTTGVD